MKDTTLFVFPDNEIRYNFQGKLRRSNKINVRCNIPNCSARRNVYIKSKIVKWGKVVEAKIKELRSKS